MLLSPSPSHRPLSGKTTQRGSTEYLSSRLDEAEAARDEEEGLKEELEWVRPASFYSFGWSTDATQEVEKLRKDLKEKTREKEEVLARLQSQRQVGAYDTPRLSRRDAGPS